MREFELTVIKARLHDALEAKVAGGELRMPVSERIPVRNRLQRSGACPAVQAGLRPSSTWIPPSRCTVEKGGYITSVTGGKSATRCGIEDLSGEFGLLCDRGNGERNDTKRSEAKHCQNTVVDFGLHLPSTGS